MITTVGDLRAFLANHGWSCERLSRHVAVSNMTWRRLLKLPDHEPIPQKYLPHLESLHSTPAPQNHTSPTPNPVALVISGLGGTKDRALRHLSQCGTQETDPDNIWTRIANLSADIIIPTLLSQLVSELKSLLKKSTRAGRLLILGALAYFLNPLDLIADHLIAIGLLDDLGVLMLVKSHITGRQTAQ